MTMTAQTMDLDAEKPSAKVMLIDAARAALLTIALCVPIVLIVAESDISGALAPRFRPWLVLGAAALVFVGRILSSLHARTPARPSPGLAAAGRAIADRVGPFAGIVGVIFLLIYPALILFIYGPEASLKPIGSYGINILIYVMLGWGLNIVVGLAGLLDLGYVAFYAVGAYSYALLATTFGLSFWICLPAAGVLAALWGMVLGFPVLRLRGDYLAIVTLAFGEIIRTVLINWRDFTGGGAGIASIPKITFFGLRFADMPGGFDDYFGLEFASVHGKIFLYYVILGLALLTNVVTIRLRRLPIGRAWEALREDEIACRSLGINTRNTKLTAFAIGAFFGGLAGSFFAVYQGFVSPESFVFSESATILAIVVLGGMGSQVGVAIAAIVLIGGFEVLRELEFVKLPLNDIFVVAGLVVLFVVGMTTRRWIVGFVLGPVFAYLVYLVLGDALGAQFPQLLLKFRDFDPAQYRGVIYGLGMVVMMITRPRGLVSSRTPSIFLKEAKAVSGSLVKEGHG